MSESVPAGWYPTPDGDQRYWDGAKWTNLPPTEPSESSESSESSEPSEPSEHEDAQPKALRNRHSRRRVLAVVIAAVVLLGATAGGVVWKTTADTAAAAKVQAAADASAAAKEEADAAAARKESADDAERASRADSTTQIEASVKKMAEGHVADGIVDGPVISATCSPTGGGSVDDLTALTTIFDCFVANKDNGDGTSSGYYYNATMNWTTGSFTYGMGRS